MADIIHQRVNKYCSICGEKIYKTHKILTSSDGIYHYVEISRCCRAEAISEPPGEEWEADEIIFPPGD